MIHDRDGQPDPDPRVPDFGEILRRSNPTVDGPIYRKLAGLPPHPDERPTGEMAAPDPDDEPYWFLSHTTPAPRSGAILAWGCLALLLAAGVAIYLAVR